MTIHSSPPPLQELENLVHEKVSADTHGDASELLPNDDQLSVTEVSWVKKNIVPRLEAARSNNADLCEGESYFDNSIKRLGFMQGQTIPDDFDQMDNGEIEKLFWALDS